LADGLVNAMGEMIQVIVNGQPQSVPSSCTLGELLRSLPSDGVRVAVECNGDVVPREHLEQRILQAGDEIEIVTLVGGG